MRLYYVMYHHVGVLAVGALLEAIVELDQRTNSKSIG